MGNNCAAAVDGDIMVSISCITYNQAPYIRQCLDGFMMQKTDFAFEVLIHDDCSTDGTDDIIREYAAKYPNVIKPLYETENQYQSGKPAGSRIWNYPRAKGKYLSLCEGDDYWVDPLKLQKQVDFLESHPDYGMCYTDCDLQNDKTGETRHSILNTQPLHEARFQRLDEFIVGREYVAPPSWMFRRDLYLSCTNFINSVDGTFVWFSYFLAKSKVHYIPDVTAVYRVLAESASHSPNYEKMYRREKNILATQKKLIDMYGLDPALKLRCEKDYYRNNLALFAIYDKKQDVNDAKKVLGELSLKQQALLCVSSLKICRAALVWFRNWRNSRR